MANLLDLIKEAKKRGGFYCYGSPNHGEERGFHIYGKEGLKDNESVKALLNSARGTYNSTTFAVNLNQDYPNEILTHKRTSAQKLTYKVTGIIFTKKEPVWENIHFRTKELLEEGTEQEAFELAYTVRSNELDHAGRPAGFAQVLVADKDLVEQIAEELKKQPEQIPQLFPKASLIGVRNGKIAIGRYEDIQPKIDVNKRPDIKGLQKFVVEYAV